MRIRVNFTYVTSLLVRRWRHA